MHFGLCEKGLRDSKMPQDPYTIITMDIVHEPKMISPRRNRKGLRSCDDNHCETDKDEEL